MKGIFPLIIFDKTLSPVAAIMHTMLQPKTHFFGLSFSDLEMFYLEHY